MLYDKEMVHPFPELVRVSPRSRELIGTISSIAKPSLAIKDREYFELHHDHVGVASRPELAFLVSLADQTTVKPVSKEYFADVALRLGDYVKEFHNYSYPGLLPLVLPEETAAYPARYYNLISLLRDAKTYRLSVGRDKRLDETWKNVLTLL